MLLRPVSIRLQESSSTCGPACLRHILRLYGVDIEEWVLTEEIPCGHEGWSVADIIKAASLHDVQLSPEEGDVPSRFPALMLRNGHFSVLTGERDGSYSVSDPQKGEITMSVDECLTSAPLFLDVVFLGNVSFAARFKADTMPVFRALSLAWDIIRPYKSKVLKMIGVLVIICIAQTLLPFMTRAIIDRGIYSQASDFILIVAIGCAVLHISIALGSLANNTVVSSVTREVKVSLLSSFLGKLLKLRPEILARYEVGDLLQRLNDGEIVQRFAMASFFPAIVSSCFVILMLLVLYCFSTSLFLVALVSFAVYLLWTFLFHEARVQQQHGTWKLRSEANGFLVNLVYKLEDIRVMTMDSKVLRKWNSLQSRQAHELDRYDSVSYVEDNIANLIMRFKEVLAISIACNLVIDGTLTMGTMFAAQYVSGLASSHLQTLVRQMRQAPQALAALNRIESFNAQPNDGNNSCHLVPRFKTIRLAQVSFRFPDGTIAIQAASLILRMGNKIGIVGRSGSGKSTLLKLLCGILHPSVGEVYLGSASGSSVDWNVARRRSFSVMLQDGGIWDGTVIDNIIADDEYDETRLISTTETASIRREIELLPASFATRLGRGGKKLSVGQQRRIQLARALYRTADFYLFDELGNSLPESQELKIVKSIDTIKSEAARVYVSHRIKPVADSDVIILTEGGRIVDMGTDEQLTERSPIYKSLANLDVES